MHIFVLVKTLKKEVPTYTFHYTHTRTHTHIHISYRQFSYYTHNLIQYYVFSLCTGSRLRSMDSINQKDLPLCLEIIFPPTPSISMDVCSSDEEWYWWQDLFPDQSFLIRHLCYETACYTAYFFVVHFSYSQMQRICYCRCQFTQILCAPACWHTTTPSSGKWVNIIKWWESKEDKQMTQIQGYH